MSDASPRPWRLTGETIRDAEGVVVVSMFNPADMETRRLIVDAVNAHVDAPGNAAALRAALKLCVREMCAYCRAEAATTMPGKKCLDGCEALRIAKAALAAPARNCDVGTAKEQAVRKANYCGRYSPLPTDNCDNCPLRGYNRASPERAIGYSCDLAWGQLPFAPEGGQREN